MSITVINSTKFSGDKWTIIEKPLNETDLERNKILSDLGSNVNVQNVKIKEKLIVIGDDFYVYVCDLLKKKISFPVRKISDQKKLNSREKILYNKAKSDIDACSNKIKQFFEDMDSRTRGQVSYDDMIKTIHYLEMRIIIMFKIIEDNIRSGKKNKKNIYEILLSSKKILVCLKKNRHNFTKIYQSEKIQLSEYFIQDFHNKILQLESICSEKLYMIASKYPKLIFDTKYDCTISEIKLKPFRSQVELITAIKDKFNDGFLIMLRALTGLGKTTSIIAVCQYIKSLSDKNNKVIFCCSNSLDTVRTQVANLMFNFDIKFSIGNKNEDSKMGEYTDDDKKKVLKYILTKSYNCSTKNQVVLDYMKSMKYKKNEQALYLSDAIVCDYYTTYQLLKEKAYEYTLFFDEPTIKIFDPYVMKCLMSIMYNFPKRTILSSATLPRKEKMRNIELFTAKKYNICDENIVDIYSSTVLIGCIINDFHGNVITPHYMCENRDQLRAFIEKIKINPLLGKFYALSFLINLNIFMINYNLEVEMDEIETFDHEIIMEQILILLERVCDNDIVDFENFKQIRCSVINDRIIDNSKKPENYDEIIFDEMLTKHASKYLGGCLIFDKDPMTFVVEHFYEKLQKIKGIMKIRSVDEMYIEYWEMMENINRQLENVDKNTKSENGNGMKEEEIEAIMTQKKKFKMNPTFQINTLPHINKFANYVSDYDESLLNGIIEYEEINMTKYNIPDEVKLLLCMGVGIYCQNIDKNYCDLVMELFNDKKLAFVISDDSLIFGSNNPVSIIIIKDSIGETLTINEILQAIGRGARVGKSYFGKVYIEDNTLQRLINFLNDVDNNDDEGDEINICFDRYVHDTYNNYITDIRKKMDAEFAVKIANEKHAKIRQMEAEKKILLEDEQEKMEWRRGSSQTTITVENTNKEVKKFKEGKVDYSKIF